MLKWDSKNVLCTGKTCDKESLKELHEPLQGLKILPVSVCVCFFCGFNIV